MKRADLFASTVDSVLKFNGCEAKAVKSRGSSPKLKGGYMPVEGKLQSAISTHTTLCVEAQGDLQEESLTEIR